ncbi:MAG: hypothetical protein ACFWUH_04535 [Limosilactobacillus fermentum]
MHHHVKYYECDTSGHPTLAMIVAMLILASEADNKENGVGPKAGGPVRWWLGDHQLRRNPS